MAAVLARDSALKIDPFSHTSLVVSDETTGGVSLHSLFVHCQGFAVAQIIPGGELEFLLAAEERIHCFGIPPDPATEEWPTVRVAAGASDEGVGVGDVDGNGDLEIKRIVWDQYSFLHLWRNDARSRKNWHPHFEKVTLRAGRASHFRLPGRTLDSIEGNKSTSAN